MTDLRKDNPTNFSVGVNDSNNYENMSESELLDDMDIDFDDDEEQEENQPEELSDLNISDEQLIEQNIEEQYTEEYEQNYDEFEHEKSEEIQDDLDEDFEMLSMGELGEEENTYEESEESSEKVNLAKEDIEDDYEEELRETKKSKKKSKKLFSRHEEDEKPIDLILYIIADKAQVGMTTYCRNYGANVSKVFTNIAEARDSLLMQIEPFRVIVIDSGTGKFTNMGARKELIDLLGICDVDTRITVFFTDSAIKTDVELADEVEDKEIHWYKYRSTPDVVAHILQNSKKEHYILDSSELEDDEVDISILNITGLPVKEGKKLDLGKPSITPDDIIFNMMNNDSEEGVIPGYNVRLKIS